MVAIPYHLATAVTYSAAKLFVRSSTNTHLSPEAIGSIVIRCVIAVMLIFICGAVQCSAWFARKIR